MATNRVSHHDNSHVTLVLDRLSAERLARALRELDQDSPVVGVYQLLHDFGYDLGATLGMTSNSDNNDPIDEPLDECDDIHCRIHVDTGCAGWATVNTLL